MKAMNHRRQQKHAIMRGSCRIEAAAVVKAVIFVNDRKSDRRSDRRSEQSVFSKACHVFSVPCACFLRETTCAVQVGRAVACETFIHTALFG